MKKIDLSLIKTFAVWRILLFFIAFLATLIIPWKGTFPYVERVLEITKLPPWIWGFGNFDGVHILRIAQNGYSFLASQAFFPLFPILIRLVSFVFPKISTLNTSIYVDPSFFYSGILISNLAFAASLVLLYRLFSLDYTNEISFKSVLLLMSFPTAFYFVGVYSESLFLLLTLLTLLFLKKRNFLLAGIFCGLATATRVVGVFLSLVLLIELIKDFRDKRVSFGRAVSSLAFSVAGIISYMTYLYLKFGNSLLFFTTQSVFGAQRSTTNLILLPQVLFRYIKIFLTTPYYSSGFFGAFLEFSMTLILLYLIIIAYKKIRFSYWTFSLGALLLSTLTGTLTSMPRYLLMTFLIFPFVVKISGKYYYVLVVLSILLQIVLLSLFVRGYWVA